MNQRIKELLDKATYEVLGVKQVDQKQFAELIVKETLQVARAGIEFGDGMEDAVYKYFGVEE